jgi:hypothetical protein
MLSTHSHARRMHHTPFLYLRVTAEEFWHANPDVQHVPVFFSSKLASKSLEVYKVRVLGDCLID